LADEAGISDGNIYDYVGIKEDIFFLLHEFMVDLVDASLSQSIENVVDPVEKLRRMVRGEFNVMYEWADAILIIYQESHILGQTKELLRKFQEREREHMQRFQDVLQECEGTGASRSVDKRVVANLIKIMADSWVLKRWDLRGHVTQLRMEKGIIDLVFNGLVHHENIAKNDSEKSRLIGAKLALMLGSGSVIGSETAAFLLCKGLETAMYRLDQSGIGELFLLRPRKGNVQSASKGDVLRVSHSDLLTVTQEEFGTFDFLLYDLGICRDYLTAGPDGDKKESARRALQENLKIMFEIASSFDEEIPKRGGLKGSYLRLHGGGMSS
jgi:3-oxoacyl-[acyl-carrier protein] reductase